MLCKSLSLGVLIIFYNVIYYIYNIVCYNELIMNETNFHHQQIINLYITGIITFGF